MRMHDARLFLPKVAIQTRQHPRLDALAPEHVIRNAVSRQLFGQHTITIQRTNCRPKPLPVQVRPDRHCDLLDSTDLERIENLDNRYNHATFRSVWVVPKERACNILLLLEQRKQRSRARGHPVATYINQ